MQMKVFSQSMIFRIYLFPCKFNLLSIEREFDIYYNKICKRVALWVAEKLETYGETYIKVFSSCPILIFLLLAMYLMSLVVASAAIFML